MTEDRSVEQRISSWLLDEAPSQLPDRVLQTTFIETRATRQARTLLPRRSPMLRFSLAPFAVGAAAMALLAVGVALSLRPSTTVGPPGPAPSVSPIASEVASPTPALPALSLPGEIAPALSLPGEVAFVATVDGNADIFLMNADRSNLRRLTDDPAEDLEPTWSADGSKLFFTRRTSAGDPERSEIHVLDIATNVETALTRTGERAADPKLSPDGRSIAYEGSGPPGVFVMNADGSDQREIFTFDGYYTLLAWAPDGVSVLLRRESTHELIRVDIGSGKATTITADMEARLGILSPDGSKRIFQRSTGAGGVWVAAADGSSPRHVFGDWTSAEYPIAWLPDGAHLLLGQADGWLYVIPIDGATVTLWAQGTSAAPRPTR